MKVYFSCSLTGGRQDQPIYAALVSHLVAQGHDVLTAHLASLDVMAEEAVVDAVAVYQRDTTWVEACDAMIAEVSTPSLGVGYEYGLAVQLGKPALCVYRSGVRLSKMITGNPAPNLGVAAYSSEAELDATVDTFLTNLTR